MTTTRRPLRAALILFLGWSLLAPGPASGQDEPDEVPAPTDSGGPEFAVQPSGPDGPGTRDWFTYTLDPGTVFGDTVAISNLSDRPMRFAIYATDAVSVDGTGAFGALKDTEEPTDVGTWIELAATQHTVEPGTRIDVPFSITVPEDAEPGDHAGAILAVDLDEGPIDPESAPDGVSFDVRHRLGARVYVRVGGELQPSLRIDELSVERDGGTATVHWEIANTGNLRLTPTAQVRITGWFGRTVRTAPVQELPELLPGATFVGASIIDGLPGNEPLSARLVVEAEGARAERSRRFVGYPWPLMVGALGLIVGGLWFLRRRRRKRRTAGQPPTRPGARVPVAA